MNKRVAYLLAIASVVAVVNVEAGRFRGGCANGQCGAPASYYPTQKVAAFQPAATTQPVVQASATQPATEVRASTGTEIQPVYRQATRRGVFRRWAR